MKNCRRTLALVVALTAALALGAARPAAAQLAATDLGTLGSYSNSGAMAVNASGMKVGFAYNPNAWGYPSTTQAVAWMPGATAPTALPLLTGYTDSMAMFVNASGQVAGTCDNGVYNQPQACRWTFDGTNWTVTGLGFLPDTSDNESEVYGINAAGQIIGRSRPAGSDNWAGFIWDSTNGMQAFTNLPAGILTIDPADRHGISDNGLVVGTAMASGNALNGAIVWDSNTQQTVAYLPSGQALAISPSGNQVAGWFLPDTSEYWQQNVFLLTWNAAGTAYVQSDLGHPAYDSGSPGWTLAGWDGYPTSVTDDGTVLGFGRNYWDTSSPADGYWENTGPTETWVYSSGTFTDLSTLLPAGTVGQVDVAPSINASGVIVFNVTGVGATAYRWDGSGEAQALPSLGGNYWVAMDINDSGMVVGTSSVTPDSPTPNHATLWSPASALDFSTPSVSVKGKALTIKIKIAASNPGTEQATNVTVTTASLAGVSTTTSLPLDLRTIRSGAGKAISLTFDSLASGSEVELKIAGTCSLGNFFTTQTVIIP